MFHSGPSSDPIQALTSDHFCQSPEVLWKGWTKNLPQSPSSSSSLAERPEAPAMADNDMVDEAEAPVLAPSSSSSSSLDERQQRMKNVLHASITPWISNLNCLLVMTLLGGKTFVSKFEAPERKKSKTVLIIFEVFLQDFTIDTCFQQC
eukprot:g21712.t1